MDLTVLNLAVPHLSADLQPSGAQLLWIVDIYGFLVGGSLITMGTLGDRIGRRRLLLIGAVAFGAASVLAAFSFTAPMLIGARAILGVASATLAPSTLSLDPQHVSRSTRTYICCGCVDCQLLRRWRARSLARRVAAGAFLVGLRVSRERARHAAVAGLRATAPPRIP